MLSTKEIKTIIEESVNIESEGVDYHNWTEESQNRFCSAFLESIGEEKSKEILLEAIDLCHAKEVFDDGSMFSDSIASRMSDYILNVIDWYEGRPDAIYAICEELANDYMQGSIENNEYEEWSES